MHHSFKKNNSILSYKSDVSQSFTQLCRLKEHYRTSSILLLLHKKCHKTLIVFYVINRIPREYDLCLIYNAIKT